MSSMDTFSSFPRLSPRRLFVISFKGSVPVGCLRVGVVQHDHELGSTRGERRTSWLSSVLRIRSKVLGSSPARHKSHNWLDIERETIPKSENRLFLYVRCGCLFSLSRLSGQVKGGVIVHLCVSILRCTCCWQTCSVSLPVVNVLFCTRARAVWDQAKTRCASLLRKPGKHVAVHERLVLESLDADEAADRLSDVTVAQIGLDMGQTRPSPLHILGGALVRDRMKKRLGSAFIKTVGVGDQEVGEDDEEG
jgi:hypothetical protein